MTYLEAKSEAESVFPEIIPSGHPFFSDWIRTRVSIVRKDRDWYGKAFYSSVSLISDTDTWGSIGEIFIGCLDS